MFFRELITNCNTFGIEFVFSVSPGLDLVFHSQQDYDQLLKKFQQLKDLGCRSFAVLWDDINAELQGVDAKGIGYNKLQIAFQEDSVSSTVKSFRKSWSCSMLYFKFAF